MLCPRCQQGDIAKAKIKATEQLIYICKECDATWFAFDHIGEVPFIDFGTYMLEIGLPPLLSELQVQD
ncbi:hypothetical protein [Noviherbaspirillum saxi]|uniref:Transcription factor zinc-finger domain-containing protein n=1 Tax=Noviherbaspirillum saxi TaxID=2320863 RepID=A0A3A3FU36_9BURK|nr:hypothetical protein [Noviherbaspirillum saxi]RJF97701.1 hypothetical protein D3871_03575 [Noviherbaspirillum saxi]